MKKIFTLCFLALGTWTTAQVDRSIMPAPTQAKKINIKDTKISNIDSLNKCTELEEAKLIIYKNTEFNFNSNKLKLLELQFSWEGSIDKVNNLPNLETLKIYGTNYVYSFCSISEIFNYVNIKNLYSYHLI